MYKVYKCAKHLCECNNYIIYTIIIYKVNGLLYNAITLKRYYKETDQIRLQPENPDMQPIYCKEVRIAGILSNIVRTY